LLYDLGSLDSCGSKVIKFDVTNVKPHLPYHMAFQILLKYTKFTIKHTIIDEGAKKCEMYLTCWKSIGSPTLSQSMTMFIAFDGCSFQPHKILPTFPVQLGGKTMEVDVEVVDAPLDYNILLGRNWTYAMTAVVSSIFHTLCFPHDGKIVTIYQLSFAHASPKTLVGTSIPILDRIQRMLVSECIPFLWVALISWHQSTTFMPFPVGLCRQ
jgi:hypothetical protein